MIDRGSHRPADPERVATVLTAAAARGLERVIADGVAAWDREAMLPRLIPVGPAELGDDSRAGRIAILRRLARALRGERVRGRAGHWSYSLDRHIGLLQAMAAERRRFAEAAGPAPAGDGRSRPADATGSGAPSPHPAAIERR